MNGALTYKDIELLRAKARGFDEALEYLKGHCDSESSCTTASILRAALHSGSQPPASGAPSPATRALSPDCSTEKKKA